MALPPRLLYRLFPYVGGISRWFEARLPAMGAMVAAVFICGVMFGLDFRQTFAMQLAVLGLGLLLASVLSSLFWRPQITLSRKLPEFVTDGHEFTYVVELSNHGTRTEYELRLRDYLRSPKISYAAFQRRRHYASRRRNLFDRAIGFPRWVELRRRDRGAETETIKLPPLAPGSSIRVPLTLTPIRRGWLRFERIDLLRPDPLGLFFARYRQQLPAQTLALPRRYAAPRIQLHSERHYQKGGVSLAHAVGDSQEFASIRDYRPGDAKRHIHWRSFAKTGELIVKEYQDEYFDRHALVIDIQWPSSDDPVFEALISVAASLAGSEQARDAILDIIFAGETVIQLSAGRGLGDSTQALSYLAQAEANADSGFAELEQQVRQRAAQLASVIVISAQMDSRRREFMTALATQGLNVLGIEIIGSQEAPVLPQRVSTATLVSVRSGHLAADLARIDLHL